jgi:hypothetical protein
MENKMFSNQ